jgi:hypothetical protein
MRILLATLLMASTACAIEPASPQLPKTGPLPEANHSTIGYATVQHALTALRNKPGAQERQEQGWTIINDRENHVVWSFTPDTHPAHPAVAKRTIFKKDGAVWVDLNVHCEASKIQCDKFVRDFQTLNDRVRDEIRRRAQ